MLKTVYALVFALGLAAASAAQKPAEHQFTAPDEVDWKPAESLGEGAEMAIIEGDPSKNEPFTMRLRLKDGLEIAPHTHPEFERVTVLSGTFYLAEGKEFDRDKAEALEPGSIAIMPPDEPMYGYVEGETVVQLHGTGPWGIEYLNPQDDPRNKQKK